MPYLHTGKRQLKRPARFSQPDFTGSRASSYNREAELKRNPDALTGRGILLALALADSKELRTADRAGALRRRTAILQRDGLGALDFSLGPALHAICLHFSTSSGTLAQQSNKIEAICQ